MASWRQPAHPKLNNTHSRTAKLQLCVVLFVWVCTQFQFKAAITAGTNLCEQSSSKSINYSSGSPPPTHRQILYECTPCLVFFLSLLIYSGLALSLHLSVPIKFSPHIALLTFRWNGVESVTLNPLYNVVYVFCLCVLYVDPASLNPFHLCLNDILKPFLKPF